jgi:hypothetical protein
MKNATLRKRAALAVTLVALLTASAAFGERRGECRATYLESGLAVQQVSFSEFRDFYAGTLCEPASDSLAVHEGQSTGGTR